MAQTTEIKIYLRSNKLSIHTYNNERKSEQAHIPTLQHWFRMLYTMNGNLKHYGWAIGQKRGYKLLLKRIKSAFPVKMHIYTLCPS